MTEHERKDFINLLARGRGLPPIYDLDDDHEARSRAAEPVDYDEQELDKRIDSRARAEFRARQDATVAVIGLAREPGSDDDDEGAQS